MKMAKASKADMDMAIELCSAMDLLGQRFIPCMPEAIEDLGADDESEPFDRDNDEQCGRALRHLLEIAERGSLLRVVCGMAVLLDPRNKLVDPNADTLEPYPEQVGGADAVDAARLEWMAANSARIIASGYGDGRFDVRWVNSSDPTTEAVRREGGFTDWLPETILGWREAIDAARAQQGGQQS